MPRPGGQTNAVLRKIKLDLVEKSLLLGYNFHDHLSATPECPIMCVIVNFHDETPVKKIWLVTSLRLKAERIFKPWNYVDKTVWDILGIDRFQQRENNPIRKQKLL